jgi:maltose phosphorylase
MNRYLVAEDWRVVERGFDPANMRSSESIFSLGNGRFGQRANHEEGYTGDHMLGSYVGGVYYPDRTRVGWWKNGYPEYFAKVLNATNWTRVELRVNGVLLDLAQACNVSEFERVLDMRQGLLQRTCVVEVVPDVTVRLETERFISMASPNRAAIRMTVTPLAGVTSLEWLPMLDGGITNEDTNWDDAFWRHDGHESDPTQGTSLLVNTTEKTSFTVGTAQAVVCDGVSWKEAGGATWTGLSGLSLAGKAVTFTKHVGLVSSLHFDAGECGERALEEALAGREAGYESERAAHVEAWAQVWALGDIRIEGDVEAQQAIRFNIFHLNQTYRGDDARLNVGPKGFTGEKYGGASYWDTEAYCLPFYLATHPPHVAEQLLRYRHNHLGKAIENAEKLGFHSGAALYPMVTMNGEECHNEWEITFEEIHRNGAMVLALRNHAEYTGDESYLQREGMEVAVGVARFWAQRAHWSEHRGGYVMLGVTGPNEYENNVNNNWYTNYLAAWCLEYAAELVDRFPSEVSSSESQQWRTVSRGMCLPQQEGTSIRLQQDGFLDKDLRAADTLDAAERPINQVWSWDRILRSCFIKQADVLQGFYFFPDDFSQEELRDNFDFYEPMTVHESSLSPCVHAILAARLGREEKAVEMYLRTSRLDLDDYNAEAYQGLHITSMAGTWMSVVEGFGGFRVKGGVPQFTTMLPAAWTSYTFKLQFRGRTLEVNVDGQGAAVTRLEGEPLEVVVNGESRHV